MAFPTCTNPARNIDRFYVVDIMPSLFGDWTVLREWGRRGSAGSVRINSYARRDEAETAQCKAPVVLPPAKPGLVDFRWHVVHELTPSTIAVFAN
jgi:predicted DNA-binding WGR domain protein